MRVSRFLACVPPCRLRTLILLQLCRRAFAALDCLALVFTDPLDSTAYRARRKVAILFFGHGSFDRPTVGRHHAEIHSPQQA